ncbi:MAG TPA: NAD-dependent epimerase/dehydratase family protein [Candidatus Dormibacteraeota bacterium]|nr:NAD-dependent epimerase/dehydratase family protein [Candidatus Dormibacteraeota bacterium]
MRALVTGGAGFVGSHVVEALLNAGHEVMVVDNLATGARGNLPPEVEFVLVDITNRAELLHAFEQFQPEVVLHQAAQTLVAASASDPIRDSQINVVGTLNVLDAAGLTGVRKIVFASSGGTVYGNPERQPVAETEPLRPISPYGVSKVAGEHYIRVICEQRGMTYTNLRYGNVFGPRDIPASQHVITAFLYAIQRGSRPVIEWDGEQSKDYVYAADVTRANLCALEHGDNESFNIGSGAEISVNNIFTMVCELAGIEVEANRAPKRAGDVRRFILDCTKAEQLLGWRPTTSFRDGLQATVDYYLGAKALYPAAT